MEPTSPWDVPEKAIEGGKDVTDGRVQLGRLGLALIASGCVQLGWVLFCVFGAAVLGLASVAGVDDSGDVMMPVLSGAYVLIGCISFPIALLQLVAGIRMRMGAGRYLGIVALAASLISMVFALYCAPLTLAVLIYGVVTYLRPEVRALFDAEPAAAG